MDDEPQRRPAAQRGNLAERLMPGRALGFGAAVLLLLAVGVGLWAWFGNPSPQSEHPQTHSELIDGIQVSATVLGSTLAATGAIADFGIEEGVAMVNVRILDELILELQLETQHDVVLARPPKVCLVGRGSAPDDAGLSDRCWGEPDLASVVAVELPTDDAGHLLLTNDRPIVVATILRRGEVRCDYPPGEWQLEVAVNLLVGDSPAGETDLPDVSIVIPLETAAPLPFLTVDQTRYCGTASEVYREQGEPPLTTGP